jgi:WD40 repeat protein
MMMRASLVSQSWRFRSALGRGVLGSRRRVAIGFLSLLALLALPWMTAWWQSEWPTRAILRTPGGTWPLAFSPDSRSFVTSSGEKVTLWDADTGSKLASWDEPRAMIGTYSPDGETLGLAVGNYPSPTTFSLLERKTGRVKVSWPRKYTGVYALAFGDSGRSVRAILGDVPNIKEAVTWDAATGQQTSSRLLTCRSSGCDTAVSGDGRLLALAPFGGTTIAIWDMEADRQLTRLANSATDVELGRGLAFSDDAKTLFVSREDGTFEIWDVPGERLKKTLRGHSGGYVSFGIRLAPDGRTLASTGENLRPSSHLGVLKLAATRAIRGRTWHPPSEVIVVDIERDRILARAEGAMHPV